MTSKRRKTDFDPCWLTPLMFARNSNFAKMRLNKKTAPREVFNSMKRIGEHGLLETVIIDFRDKAFSFLEANNLPTTYEKLKKLSRFEQDALPAEAKYIYEMLHHFFVVQEKIKIEDAEGAAYNMMIGVLAATRAEIRPIEPIVEYGKKYGKIQSIKAGRPRTRNGMTPTQRRDRNERIVRHFKKTRLTESNFSQKNEVKYGLKARQIRNILKKALGS